MDNTFWSTAKWRGLDGGEARHDPDCRNSIPLRDGGAPVGLPPKGEEARGGWNARCCWQEMTRLLCELIAQRTASRLAGNGAGPSLWHHGLALLMALGLWCGARDCRAALIAGDLAVIGVNGDNPDQFSWVPLVDLNAGQELFFSDSGWIEGQFSGSAGATSDGALRYVAPSGGLSAGAVQVVTLGQLNADYSPANGAAGNRFLFSTAGDQLVAFAGSLDAPDFLFGLNFAGASWQIDSGSSSNNIRSQLYPGLIDRQTALALGTGPDPGDEFDNVRYQGTTSGTRSALLASLVDPGNWIGTNSSGTSDRFEDLTRGISQFHVLADSPPPPGPEVSAVPEPSALAAWCLLAAVVGLSLARRRRQSLPGRTAWPTRLRRSSKVKLRQMR